jgi:NAD(P)-dependent dehydrogenase (short-subunit alcohol dehydrogenase family)
MKVWFVAGSSRGLGLAIVEAALKSGGLVIATARKGCMGCLRSCSLADSFLARPSADTATELTSATQAKAG